VERYSEERDGKLRVDFFIRNVRTKYEQPQTFIGNMTIPLDDSLTVSVGQSMLQKTMPSS